MIKNAIFGKWNYISNLKDYLRKEMIVTNVLVVIYASIQEQKRRRKHECLLEVC